MTINTESFDREYSRPNAEPNTGAATLNRIHQRGREILDEYLSSHIDRVEPFDEMTKQEMIDHLLEAHGLQQHQHWINSRTGNHTLSRSTKATKDQLADFHKQIHANQDAAEVEFFVDSRSLRYAPNLEGVPRRHAFLLGRYPIPAVRHEHLEIPSVDPTDPTVTPRQQEVLEAIRDNTKPVQGSLTATDRRVLKELVDNDFNALKQEMLAFSADAWAARKREIEDEWDEKQAALPDYASQAANLKREQREELEALERRHQMERNALTDKHEDALSKIIAAADQQGVTLTDKTEAKHNHMTGKQERIIGFRADAKGRQEALAAAEKESRTFLDRALLTLEKQRLTAQRKVLLAGVPDSAMEFVESLPTAKDLMVEAAQEKVETKQISS